MTFRESITAQVLKLLNVKIPDERTSIDETVPSRALQSTFDVYNRISVDGNRAAQIDLMESLYKTDPRVSSVITTLSRDTVKGGFRLVAQKNPKAEDLANALIRRIKLNEQLEDFVKNWFLEGDLFLENGVTVEDQIVEVKVRPAKEMRRLTNRIDEFITVEKAFRWQLDYTPSEQDIVYAKWQIIHARWDRIKFEKYGRPLLASGNAVWQRINQGEDDMVKARANRAGIARLHVLEGANQDQLKEYKKENQDALSRAFAAVANFYSNAKTSLTQVEGSTNLPKIEDIQHHLETWFTGSPVPMALLGYGGNLSRDVIELKEKQYRRSIEQITRYIQTQIIIPVIELEWLLNGILPEDVEYETEWKSKDPLTAADLRDIADSVLRFKAVGVKDDLIAFFISRFIPGVDIKTLIEQLKEGQQQLGSVPGVSSDGSGNNFNTPRAQSTVNRFGVALNRK